jgi:serpin B
MRRAVDLPAMLVALVVTCGASGGGGIASFIALLAGCNSASSAPGAGAGPTGPDGGPSERVARVDIARDPVSGLAPSDVDVAVAANNAFAVDLYGRLEADAGTGNLLVSPISASLALTMAYAGAVGQTATEMAAALHFGPDAGSSIFDGQNALDQTLTGRGAAALASVVQNNAQAGVDAAAPSPSDYELQVVNSVWGEKTYTWSTPFLTIMAKSYGAGVYLEDFINQPDEARQAINAWVGAETDDKIENLLPEGAIDPMTRMVLVNAIHLKFPWANPFDPSTTQVGSFTRADGTTVSPSFMNDTLRVPYTDDGQAQIVGLPLSGGDLSVVIALPHEGTRLQAYESALSTGSAALAQPSSTSDITLSIPKVTFTSPTFSLKPALQAMGMEVAFTPAANFTGMYTGGGLYLFDVLQKTTIAMQETGVEAAAATAVLIEALAAESPSASVIVNRPYLVAIIDVPTGAILFLGQVEDPTAGGT